MKRLKGIAGGARYDGQRSSLTRLAVGAAFAVLLLAAPVPKGKPQTGEQISAPRLESVHIGAFDADAWNGIVFDASVCVRQFRSPCE